MSTEMAEIPFSSKENAQRVKIWEALIGADLLLEQKVFEAGSLFLPNLFLQNILPFWGDTSGYFISQPYIFSD